MNNIFAKKTYKIKVCEYFKNQNGYVSGCGYVAAYNKYWKFCPYCGNSIIIVNRKYNAKK